MNILSTILDRLNQRIEVGNIFDQIYGLSELVGEGNDKAWAFYIGNGQAIPVTNYDAKQGTLFWAKRGKITVSKNDSLRLAGCKSIYETKFSMTAYAMVRKSHLPCDSADAQDWVASRVLRLISGTDPQFKTAIGAIAYEVVPSGYATEARYLPVNYEWAAVAIDVDVNVSTSSEDGCYDTCATGDIPLPDFEPCEPCLTSVAVDGITIIGNGTPADPLIAVGGGGGGSLTVRDEGTVVSSGVVNMNFRGASVNVNSSTPGSVNVDVQEVVLTAGTGISVSGTYPSLTITNTSPDTPQDLQDVTDLGNSTTNDIDFIGTAGLSFDNGARFRKGTTDAGNGGAKGTAQLCSISYELKWEAGRLYYMEQDGFTIRDVTHNFTFVPQPTDDSTKGFVVGSRWSLDDGTVYLCTDATIGAAVWAVQSASVPNLQDVTDVGNTTTNDLIVQGANDYVGQVSSQSISAFNTVSGAYAEMFVGTSGQLSLSDGTSAGIFTINNLTSTNVQLEFPNKTTGTYTIATTADLTGGTVTSVAATVPTPTNPAFSVSVPNPSTTPSVDITANGTTSQYVRGDGSLETFPTIPVVTGFVPYTGATQDLDMGTHNITADHIALNVNPSGAGFVVGATQWNNTIGSSETLLKGGNVILKNGVDLVARIVNKVTPNTTLTKAAYQAVRVAGATGGRLSVQLAKADTDNNSADTIGLVTETIATNQEGFIMTVGQLLDINTTGSLQGETWADGDVLYLSPTTAGQLTNIKPTGATGHIVVMGYVEYAHPSNGAIYVKVMNGWELDELHNVYINSPANNDALVYETATQLWKNKSLGTILGGTTSQYVRGNGTLATFPTLPLIYKDLNNQTAVTGNTNNNKVVSVLIPANTITVGNIIEIKARAGKTGAAGITTLRVYANTADSIVTPAPTLLTTTALASIATNYIGIDRTAIVKSATITQTAQANASIPTDAAIGTASLTNSNIDWTVNQYIIFALQNGAAGDSTVLSYYQIEIK